jgi:hypothetical protein
MRTAMYLTCLFLALAAAELAAQQVFEVGSWSLASTNGVKSDSTGALVLGDVDSETNLASRKIAADQTGEAARVTDANFSRNSAWNSLTPQAFNYYVQIDLEEPRLISRVAILPVSGNITDFIKGYSFFTSMDNVVFTEQVHEPRNVNVTVDTSFTPVVARYVRVQVKAIDRVHNVQISEIEVYGEGFVSSATFESDAIDLNEAADKNFGVASWSSVTPEGTTMALSFRIGSTGSPAEEDANWSDWTEPSDARDGILLRLPEPNRYLQYRVSMTSNDPSVSPRLEGLNIEYGAPLAASFTGEVSRTVTLDADDTLAVEEAVIGAQQTFDLRLLAEPGDGFDLLRVELPNRGIINSVSLNGASAEDVTTSVNGNTVEMDFGQRFSSRTEFLINLTSVLFDERNVFSAQLVDLAQPGNPQQIEASDVREDALAIYGVGVSGRVFDKGTLTVAPNPFSPDNDGRYDAVEFTYELAKISTPQEATLRLFDLTGRPLQELSFQQKSGTHTISWDGRDGDGELVSPGLYLFQVDIDSGERVRFNGSVAVSY